MGYLGSAGLSHLWEKIGTKLSDKQDKLTGSPGQTVGFDMEGTAVAQDSWSNPNLLDNWCFTAPINQRGKTEYVGGGYSIDRWYLCNEGIKFELADSGLNVSCAKVRDLHFASQRLDRARDLLGKTVTLSVLVAEMSSGMQLSCELRASNSVGLISVGVGGTGYFNTSGLYSVTFRIPDSLIFDGMEYSGLNASIVFPNSTAVNEYAVITAMKLERGDRQTLAHQDEDGNWVLNEMPNKALELARCQRFQYKNTNGATEFIRAGRITPNSIYFDVPLPVPMRANPVLNDVDSLSIYNVVQTDTAKETAVLGFSFHMALLGGATLRIQAVKTAHGLLDACLFATGCLFDANL